MFPTRSLLFSTAPAPPTSVFPFSKEELRLNNSAGETRLNQILSCQAKLQTIRTRLILLLDHDSIGLRLLRSCFLVKRAPATNSWLLADPGVFRRRLSFCLSGARVLLPAGVRRASAALSVAKSP